MEALLPVSQWNVETSFLILNTIKNDNFGEINELNFEDSLKLINLIEY